MYEETPSLYPNSMADNNNMNLPSEELSYHPDVDIHLQNPADMAAAGAFNSHFIHDSSNHEVLAFNSSSLPPDSSYPTPDLLNLFHLPRCSVSSSLLPNSSISFSNPSHNFAGDLPLADASPASSIVYDPLLYLNLPPQPPLIRDLFQSLPPNGFLPGSRGSSLFGGGGVDDHGERNGGGIYPDGGGDGEQYDNGVLDFSWEMDSMGKGRKGGKVTKHFATERQRRQQLNDKYDALKNLIPVRTKDDRASIVADAITYIKELMASVNDLKMLVEKKRCVKDRNKRLKTEEDSIGNGVDTSSIIKPLGDLDLQQSFNNGTLRSSWLQRKSKDTEVDVRIVDDEVTIKLVQRKRINCLLSVSKVLDELQLDLNHVAGGHVGDYYSFLFNTKINEGSSIYASAIANKVIEVVDTVYANAATPNSGGCFYHMRELSVDGR